MSDLGRQAGRPLAGGGGRRLLWTLSILGLVCALVMGIGVASLPRRSVVRVIEQPPTVEYADGSTHVAVLHRVRAPIAALRLSPDTSPALDHYEVVLGRDRSGGYGHQVRLDATGLDPAELTVEWTADGAWLDYPSGHRLFVPADSFTGGR
jgi:hypothetical protein